MLFSDTGPADPPPLSAHGSPARPRNPIDREVEAARVLAKRSGTRLTAIREHVYRTLLAADRPIAAYDILQTLDGVGSRKPPTVYRSLDWLIAHGLARRITSLAKFVVTPPDARGQTADLAFLLCRQCGEAQTVAIPAFGQALADTARALDFRQEDTVVELVGLCGKAVCREAADRAALPEAS